MEKQIAYKLFVTAPAAEQLKRMGLDAYPYYRATGDYLLYYTTAAPIEKSCEVTDLALLSAHDLAWLEGCNWDIVRRQERSCPENELKMDAFLCRLKHELHREQTAERKGYHA